MWPFFCFAGERGDGGEAGGPVSSHRVQHSDAGLQEDPWESVSNGLEPQHVQLLVANAGPRRVTDAHAEKLSSVQLCHASFSFTITTCMCSNTRQSVEPSESFRFPFLIFSTLNDHPSDQKQHKSTCYYKLRLRMWSVSGTSACRGGSWLLTAFDYTSIKTSFNQLKKR